MACSETSEIYGVHKISKLHSSLSEREDILPCSSHILLLLVNRINCSVIRTLEIKGDKNIKRFVKKISFQCTCSHFRFYIFVMFSTFQDEIMHFLREKRHLHGLFGC